MEHGVGGEQLLFTRQSDRKAVLEKHEQHKEERGAETTESVSRTGGASFQKETAASLSKAAAHQKSLIRSFGYEVGLRQSAGFEV